MNIRWNLRTIFPILFILITIIILRAYWYRGLMFNERAHYLAVLENKISAFFGSKIPTPQFTIFIELPRESLLFNKPVLDKEEPFVAKTVKPQTRFRVGEEIFFQPVLISLTPKPVTILPVWGGHLSVDVQDEWGRSLDGYPYPRIARGYPLHFTLRAGEHIALGSYKPWGEGSPSQWREYLGWDPARYPGKGGYKVVFDQPGRYQIAAYAHFTPFDMTSFKPKPLTSGEWQIYAIPVWIKVDP